MSALIRAFDKEFSLAANYPKGHGEEFKEWIKSNHPGELLLQAERSSVSCQDLFVEGAPEIYSFVVGDGCFIPSDFNTTSVYSHPS